MDTALLLGYHHIHRLALAFSIGTKSKQIQWFYSNWKDKLGLMDFSLIFLVSHDPYD